MKNLAYVFLMLIAFNSHAEFLSGSQFMERCKDYGKTDTSDAYCEGYVAGVVDSQNTLKQMGLIKGIFCPPEKVTIEQYIAWAIEYFKNNPNDLQYSADSSLPLAYEQIYPCIRMER